MVEWTMGDGEPKKVVILSSEVARKAAGDEFVDEVYFVDEVLEQEEGGKIEITLESEGTPNIERR